MSDDNKMENDFEVVMKNLENYASIKEFLRGIIKQRLQILHWEYGMLTAQLLDGELSKIDLNRLNDALKLGSLYCVDFKQIFQIGRLPENPKTADDRIVDMLAEVKVVEILHQWDGKEIIHLWQRNKTPTTDFIANIDNDKYAVEVTRLGLPCSNRKKSTALAAGGLKNTKGDPFLNIPCWKVRQLTRME